MDNFAHWEVILTLPEKVVNVQDATSGFDKMSKKGGDSSFGKSPFRC
jgi:hypothetical protein